MSLRALTTLLCVLSAGAYAAPADAAIHGGGPVTITARSQGSASCQLSANHESLRRVRTINAHHVEFEFTVAGRAHPGRYLVTAKCGAQRKSTRRLAVPETLLNRGSRRALTRSVSVTRLGRVAPTLPALGHPTPSAESLAVALGYWGSKSGAAYRHAFRNGECPDIVQRKRPDIVEAVFVTMYAVWGDSHFAGKFAVGAWNATDWDDNAAAAGMEVGAAPRAGAVMVFNSGDPSSSPGHIAYVEQLRPNGDLLITEENAPKRWRVTQRVVSVSELESRDIDFIY
jgi:hypothetical protein